MNHHHNSLTRIALALGLGLSAVLALSLWHRDPCAAFERMAKRAARLEAAYPRPYRLSDHVVGILHHREPMSYYEEQAARMQGALLASGDLVETRIPVPADGSERDMLKTLYAVCQRTGYFYTASIDTTNHQVRLISKPKDVAVFSAALLLAIPQSRAVGAPLPRGSPESQGISSRAVRAYVEALDRIDMMHSFMIVRHGRVIAEGWWKPQAADQPHLVHSVSKSFNATAVGMAIAEGKLSLDDRVLKFFPKEAPRARSDPLKAMTVRDLLTMTCGHDAQPTVDLNPSVEEFLAFPVQHRPGTHFAYNNAASYTLSAIVTKVTGQTVQEYLQPRLFEPLGIDHTQWRTTPEGFTLGWVGLSLHTESIAKLGQLYLQKGRWNGTQLIPETWVEQATRKQVSHDQGSPARREADWQQGYGFQFWRCTHNAFRAEGSGGQFCVVMPDQDVVVAMTADAVDMQGELTAIGERLLPAFQPAPLPEDAAGHEELEQAVANLQVRWPKRKNRQRNSRRTRTQAPPS